MIVSFHENTQDLYEGASRSLATGTAHRRVLKHLVAAAAYQTEKKYE